MPATEQTWRDQKLLHKIFAIGSLLLLISTIWMFVKDNDRQWKGYQRTFRDIEVTNSQWDKVRAEIETNEEERKALEAELIAVQSGPPEAELFQEFLAEAAKGFKQQQARDQGIDDPAEIEKLELSGRNSQRYDHLVALYEAIETVPIGPAASDGEEAAKRFVKETENAHRRVELFDAMGDVQARATFLEDNLLNTRKMKAAEFDAAKSVLDLSVRDDQPTDDAQAAAAQVKQELEQLTAQYQQASDHRKELARIVDELTAEERRINELIADSEAELEQITAGIDERRANWIEGYWIGKKILESPIVDAFGSPLKIENLWTEGLTHNQYNFKPVLRYDRCTTCHQAMEKTQAGSAVDPKYQAAHNLTFALNAPTEAELAELEAALNPEVAGDAPEDGAEETSQVASDEKEAKDQLQQLYGFLLAPEGILHRDDVTINYVRGQSPAAKAKLRDDEEGVRYLSAELIEASVSAPFDGEERTPPQFGLAVGDVIVSINGDKILSVDDVRRKLLETVEASNEENPAEPINIEVRRGYPHPFVTHPRLDLFVGSTSPHKLQVMGCTVCHEGQGSATEFKWVSHSPNTQKQRDEWRKEYGWFDNHHWIYPMFPKRFAESSCLKCHHNVTELEPSERYPEPPAPQLMSGYNTVRRYGCFGCHEIVGYDGPDKRIGPDMRLEPNYFAAGAQLVHMSAPRIPELEKELPELKSTVETRQQEQTAAQTKVDEASAAVAEVQAELKALRTPEEEGTEPSEEEIAATEERLKTAQGVLETANAELDARQEATLLAEAELAMYEARIATLKAAIERGNRLADAPEDDDNRRRLLEMITDDQQGLKKFNDAVAAGEEVDLDFVPAFTPEIYNTAMVLKDDEMPGKFRKVGPSLRYVKTKLDDAFLDDWIREPKHFRPSSRMPQFFRLFDHIQGESTDPELRKKQTAEMRHHTADLEDIEIQGIRTYLQEYSQDFQPVEGGDEVIAQAKQPGDAARGKVLFEIGGCLACHSNDDFPNQGDQGPDLTGLGSKLTGEAGRAWLYGWIQNPKRYHARTKMPIVPLKALDEGQPDAQPSDPIADVVEYLLEDKTDWKSHYADAEIDSDRLDELSLMHLEKAFSKSFARRYLQNGIPEERRSTLKGAEVELLMAEELVTAGEELSQKQKLLYIGNKSISKYGCYACHDIPGFEGAKPIGTALSDWGRKDPSKLAFEHINHYVGHGAHGHGGHGNGGHGHDDEHEDDEGHEEEHTAHDDHHADPEDEAYYHHQLHHHSRTGFIHQKLKEPRSYDYAKLANKPYNDRLRMPMFPLDHEQHEQVITFVLGLVADPPAEKFVYQPTPRQEAINEGRKVLDKFNCAGCHELEREEWTITYPENWDRLSPPGEPTTYPFLIPHVSQAEINASTDVSRSGRLTGVLSGRVKRGSRGDLDISAYDPLDEDYLPLEELEEDEYAVDALAYRFELYEPAILSGRLYMPKESLPIIPLNMIKRRQARRGGDLATYLMPRVLKYTTSANQSKGEEAWGWVPPSLVGQGRKTNPDWLHSFLLDPHPIRPAAMLNMPKFNMSAGDATKLVNYFSAKDGAEYPYQFDARKRSAHLEEAASQYRQAYEQVAADRKELFSGDRFDDIMKIVTSQAGCVKCHNVGDYISTNDPRAKGPDLWNVHQRLQPSYVRRWVAKPNYILPYTAMPELIKYNPHNPQEDGFLDARPDGGLAPVYNGSSTQQLDAIVDLLMNFDQYAARRASFAELVPDPPAAAEGEDTPAGGGDEPADDSPDQPEGTPPEGAADGDGASAE